MIREAISAAVAGESLSLADAVAVMREVMEGAATPAQLGAYLTALSLKGETPEEIAGFATVMREKSLRVNAPGRAIDTCGTGGDRKPGFDVDTPRAALSRRQDAMARGNCRARTHFPRT